MARRHHEDALGVTGAETVIGSGVIVHGTLESEADIIIDGTLDGSIKTVGNLTIGVNAHVKANVEATNVTVLGALDGNILAGGEAVIRETGHVKGDVRSAGLAISSGGIFIGRSIMEALPRLQSAPEEADTPSLRPPEPPAEDHSVRPKGRKL